MINSHPSNPTNELEITEVFFIAQSREWINLKGVVIPDK
jgi:hypothetical protein